MRSEEDIRKAYALTAKAAEDTKEEQPMESATAFVLMKGFAWILEEEAGDELFEELEEEFKELEAEEE